MLLVVQSGAVLGLIESEQVINRDVVALNCRGYRGRVHVSNTV